MDVRDLYEPLDDKTRRQLKIIAESICKKDKVGQYKGDVILFLGAGVNYHAPEGFEAIYPRADRPPMAVELAEQFIDDYCSTDKTEDRKKEIKNEKYPLSWITQLYEETADRRQLIEKLSSFIDNKKTSPILKALAKMPFKYIVTTNYDLLFEDALRHVGKRDFHKGIYKANNSGRPLEYEQTTDVPDRDVAVERPFLYKLHGDIEDVFDKESGAYLSSKDSIVLTDEDYLHFILRMSQVADHKERDESHHDKDTGYYPIPQSINKAFSVKDNNRTFLFVGYGLRDYNLRLIFKTALWKKDNNVFQEVLKWSIDAKPEGAIPSIWERNYHFTFIERDIWRAIPFLYKLIFNEEMPL